MVVSLANVYAHSPTWLQDVMVTAYGYRLRRLRYGGIHHEVLIGLRRSQWLAAPEVAELQRQRLVALVAHARRTVPLYRDRAMPALESGTPAELATLPTVSKEDLRATREHITSSDYRDAHLHAIHTGGTSGTPLTIYCDAPALQRNYAFFARFREWAGIPSLARVATFAGRTIVPVEQQRPPFWRRNAAANTWLFSSYHLSPTHMPSYVEALARLRVELIDSYPSSLEPIARYVVDQGITTIRPKAIITSSETLRPVVRDLLERAFAAPIYDHYGSAELAALITQCERGTYHVNPEFGIVEVLRDGQPAESGQVGELVVTGFVNPVMPLIRYRTGDLAIPGAGACACGRAFPILDRIIGRLDDVLVTPEGRRVGRLDPIFKAVSTFQAARIVQDASDHVRVELVSESDIAVQEQAVLVRELRARLGTTMRIDVMRVSAIPRTGAGKLRTVVNLVGGGEQTAGFDAFDDVVTHGQLGD
jgi:phenylacetate-coenzyme A ligase PaaK-like adenylate-forming protein